MAYTPELIALFEKYPSMKKSFDSGVEVSRVSLTLERLICFQAG
jgi:hypothetical protein